MGRPEAAEIDVLIDDPAWSARNAAWEDLAARAVAAALDQARADSDGDGDSNGGPSGLAGARPLEISLLLTSDDRQRTLNRDHRGVDRPTNVLSFPSGDDISAGAAAIADMPHHLGDISLAWGVVAAEAAAGGVAVEDHVAHLVIHGLLHLLGYDHVADAEAARMEGLETAALARLGIADPYAVPHTDSGA